MSLMWKITFPIRLPRNRLQKRARDFENDVIEVEQKYIEEQHIYKAELKNNKEQMYLLRQKIIETEETNKNLTEKIEKYLSQIKQLNIEINELKQVEVEMLNSLTVLEATNDTYVNEIERLQYGADTCDATTELEDDSKTEECVRRHSTTEVHPVSELSSSSVAENVPTTGNVSRTSFEAGPEVPINTIQRKKKIIIYGDEYARNFRKSLDILGVGHGGTAIYSRKELHCIPLPNINNCSKQQQCEIAATKVTEIGLVIISVYRPPSGNLEVFLEIIENILTLVSKHSNVVVAGDFNIHFNYANSQRDRLIDLFDSFNFFKTIHVPTRGSNCLDNIFINFSHEYFKASCDNPVLSDHLSQSLELNLPCKVVERSSNKICRPITKIGKHIFYSLVETINWDFVDDNVLSVDAKFTYLINLLNRTYVEAFREKKVNGSSSKENLKWFCDELALMRETLHFLNSACKRNNTPENINTRNKFRKQYRTAITQAKIKTNDNFIKESPNKSKAIWKIIAGNTKQKDYSNEITLNADEFNQHFVTLHIVDKPFMLDCIFFLSPNTLQTSLGIILHQKNLEIANRRKRSIRQKLIDYLPKYDGNSRINDNPRQAQPNQQSRSSQSRRNNVFLPNSQRQLSQPTPMSVSTRDTFRPPETQQSRSSPPNNFFKSTSKPNFSSEELFNIDDNPNHTNIEEIFMTHTFIAQFADGGQYEICNYLAYAVHHRLNSGQIYIYYVYEAIRCTVM
nr:unnamed protein product [Callosobruchus analis]